LAGIVSAKAGTEIAAFVTFIIRQQVASCSLLLYATSFLRAKHLQHRLLVSVFLRLISVLAQKRTLPFIVVTSEKL
jgi:hypothetical protein